MLHSPRLQLPHGAGMNRRELLQSGIRAHGHRPVVAFGRSGRLAESGRRRQERDPAQIGHPGVPDGRGGSIGYFDLKPEAPAEIRGEFQPIASRTPGLLICEHLPRLAPVPTNLPWCGRCRIATTIT